MEKNWFYIQLVKQTTSNVVGLCWGCEKISHLTTGTKPNDVSDVSDVREPSPMVSFVLKNLVIWESELVQTRCFLSK